jgi:hypothetical protein
MLFNQPSIIRNPQVNLLFYVRHLKCLFSSYIGAPPSSVASCLLPPIGTSFFSGL